MGDDAIKVGVHFQRSVRIDYDINDSDIISSYICPQSSIQILQNMKKGRAESGESAFTWTGPYGSGKSSLVVILSALLGQDIASRNIAEKVIGSKSAADIQQGFGMGWRFVPVVGHKGNAETAIVNMLNPGKRGPKGSALKAIEKAAEEEETGLFIVIDEMGKFLEAASESGQDIYFFQQLAELAARSGGKIIILGVLHQAFAEYARRLTREMRDEWAKIQGRYADLPLNLAGEEQIDLIGRAVVSATKPEGTSESAQIIAKKISHWRPVDIELLAKSLTKCWPLHPVTSALLGPISRRRFGQNQRSVFGFLNSSEPSGFQEFIKNRKKSDVFSPAQLWDYLRANLEPSIMASPDGHRWSLAIDALSRAEASGADSDMVQVIKSIAIIDMFQERSGLVPEGDVLLQCVSNLSELKLNDVLSQLESWSIIRYKKHKKAYSLYEGSDFDIEAATKEAYEQISGFDLGQLKTAARFQPIVAKRHYHETGALRWMEVDLVPAEYAVERAKSYTPSQEGGAMGLILVILGTENDQNAELDKIVRKASKANSEWPVIVSAAASSRFISSHTKELQALEWIQSHNPALGGDTVARREVVSRIASIRDRLEESLSAILSKAQWSYNGIKPKEITFRNLQTWVSDQASEKYSASPRINSELTNRIKPSSNSVAALKILLKAMVERQGEGRLGIAGYPAEGGLYETLIARTGLYEGKVFKAPTASDDPCKLYPLWEEADRFFRKNENRAVALSELYDVWKSPPYGVKDGLLPFFAVSFILSRIHNYAAYLEGVYRPSIDDLFIDILMKSPQDIALRPMNFSDVGQKILAGVCHSLNEIDASKKPLEETSEPLEIARRLVATVMELPPYILRTRKLSNDAIRLRELIKNANDPNKVLFDDLPHLFKEYEENLNRGDVQPIIDKLRLSLNELVNAYPLLLKELHEELIGELQAETANNSGLKELQKRAKNIMHISGDFKLDAFAARLVPYSGESTQIEGIASLAADKPTRDWIDLDVSRAKLRIAELSQQFNHIEAFGRVQNRRDYRQAVAFMVGQNGTPRTYAKEFTIRETDQERIAQIEKRIRGALNGELKNEHELLLAALANIGAEILQEHPEPEVAQKEGVCA